MNCYHLDVLNPHSNLNHSCYLGIIVRHFFLNDLNEVYWMKKLSLKVLLSPVSSSENGKIKNSKFILPIVLRCLSSTVHYSDN